MSAATLRLSNEFASVDLAIETSACGARLRLLDVKDGTAALVDPLVLVALVHVDSQQIDQLVDPANQRWGRDLKESE